MPSVCATAAQGLLVQVVRDDGEERFLVVDGIDGVSHIAVEREQAQLAAVGVDLRFGVGLGSGRLMRVVVEGVVDEAGPLAVRHPQHVDQGPTHTRSQESTQRAAGRVEAREVTLPRAHEELLHQVVFVVLTHVQAATCHFDVHEGAKDAGDGVEGRDFKCSVRGGHCVSGAFPSA
jgi:hypothetical protein